MSEDVFWRVFRKDIQPELRHRANTFTKIFEYLDSLNRPVVIVETGCVRALSNWGEGQSTLLFDTYAKYTGSRVYSVDNNAEFVAAAAQKVSDHTTITVGDSVAYLSNFEQAPDLVYLDSFDLDVRWPLPSAIHHLKELTAIMPKLTRDSLVVVDDSFMEMLGLSDKDVFKCVTKWIGGKAKFIAEYAEDVGVEPLFVDFQCGWVNLARRP